MKKFMSFCMVAILSGCGFVNYSEAPAGTFTGSVFVLWVGENDTGSGDGRFVFVPVEGDELTFTRKNPDATMQTITPGLMYTDGGSIPRAAQVFKGFSPWGYAPAYMVHDWLFVARKCLNDGAATGDELMVKDMPFIESAEVLAEAIQTLVAANLVQKNDVALLAISSATAGPVSRALWKAEGECEKNRLSKEHYAKVERFLAVQRGAVKRLDLDDGIEALVIVEPDPSVQLVTQIRF